MEIFGYTIIKTTKLDELIAHIVEEHEAELKKTNELLCLHLDAEKVNLENLKNLIEESDKQLNNINSIHNKTVVEFDNVRNLYKQELDKNYKLEEAVMRKDDLISNLQNEIQHLKEASKPRNTRKKKSEADDDKQA